MILRCEMCKQNIGTFEVESIKKPLRGNMFGSIMAKNGLAPPFHRDLDWLTMRCPYCKLRPFLTEDYVMTPEGQHNLLTPDELMDKLFGEYDPEPPAGEKEPEPVELTETEKKNAEMDRLMSEPTAIDEVELEFDGISIPEPKKTTNEQPCKFCGKLYKSVWLHERYCKNKPGAEG